MNKVTIVEVTPQNAMTETLFCIKNVKNPGFRSKLKWYKERFKEGLRIKILKDEKGEKLAFIEYVPAEYAWRPVDAPGFMFIHCMYVYYNYNKGRGYGSLLLESCEEDARQRKLHGVCKMTSSGPWMADKQLLEKNGYEMIDQKGRFELLSKSWNSQAESPKLKDWTRQQKEYKGWHLLYADQCPWHEKSVLTIKATAQEYGIKMNIKRINSAREAQNAPSGFGVFNLLKDGKLLVDHYISNTRFKNIINKELSHS